MIICNKKDKGDSEIDLNLLFFIHRKYEQII